MGRVIDQLAPEVAAKAKRMAAALRSPLQEAAPMPIKAKWVPVPASRRRSQLNVAMRLSA